MPKIPKPIRHIDESVLELRRNEPCCVCGKKPPSDPSHVISRGAGGPDFLFNVAPHCRACHIKFHALGRYTFTNKYPTFKKWLLDHGWQFTDDRWVMPRAD